MRSDFLDSLHCPYSGSPLSLSKVAQEDEEEIEYGIATSEAGDFPIVEGILRLHLDEYREPIVEHVRAKRISQALIIALDGSPFHGRIGAAINFASGLAFKSGFNIAGERLSQLKRNYAGLLTDNKASFVEVAEKLSPGASADWQICRFSMPTFLPVFPLLHIVKTDGSILDFGCGNGQAAFLISRTWPNSKIVCADYSFSSLYLAKKYFAPDASYVCVNGDYLLPFESGQFSTVFSSDTLHCIDSKLSLIQEFRRVSSENAVTILPHLHNRLASAYGKSFTPRGYRALFRGMEIRILPEEEVIGNYFFDDTVDLRINVSEEEVAASKQGLSIVASTDPSVFKRREHLWDQRIRSFRHPRANPAYRITGQSGDWTLFRRTSEKYAKTLTGAGKICLPASFKVAARSLDATGLTELQQTDSAKFAELAKTLLVLDLPERFMAEHEEAQHGNHRRVASAAV